MTRIVLDDSVLAQLPTSRGYVEVCDVQGRVHGIFQALMPDEQVSLESDISEEEMERRAKLPVHGRTLAEILADWNKRK